MDFTLKRYRFADDGIFGELLDDTGAHFCYVLEHAYPNEDGSFSPKVPEGVFTCVRGPHRLDGMTHDFETFEVTGVAGHAGILLHPGNTEGDSSGCLLVGETDTGSMITHSRATFARFMAQQDGLDNFTLTVSNS